ncbi:hypothetical protein HAX54_030449, partial [Datura stramonium]|nr:hypothetical protein [Datura stramonium]
MKLQLTAAIQVLKRAAPPPSKRLVSHENCRFSKPTRHEYVHIQKITEASGTEKAKANANFDNALKEAIKGRIAMKNHPVISKVIKPQNSSEAQVKEVTDRHGLSPRGASHLSPDSGTGLPTTRTRLK